MTSPNTTQEADEPLTDLQRFEIAHHEAIKGIDDYTKYKGSDDEVERIAAWINQLSPWNLERAIDVLRDREAAQKLELLERLEAAIDNGKHSHSMAVIRGAIQDEKDNLIVQ